MSVIQALGADAEVPAKWPNHVWSPKAVNDAILKSTTLIKLTSTKDEVAVHIHRELLCFFSSYYAAALNGQFLEAKKDSFEVDLSGEHLQVFAVWIYRGEFNMTVRENMFLLISLYIFADQVDIMALRRSAVSHIAELNLPPWNMVKLILTNVTQQSPLRRLVLDTFINHWMSSDDANDECVMNHQDDPDYALGNFMFELLKGLRLCYPSDANGCSCCNDICEYHEHESEEEQNATCGQIQDAKLTIWACQ